MCVILLMGFFSAVYTAAGFSPVQIGRDILVRSIKINTPCVYWEVNLDHIEHMEEVSLALFAPCGSRSLHPQGKGIVYIRIMESREGTENSEESEEIRLFRSNGQTGCFFFQPGF